MPEDVLIIGFYGGVALLIALCGVVLALLLSPKKKNLNKSQPFECGMAVVTPPKSLINARFYLYGLIFLLFDIELIFLIPWALSISHVGMAGFVVGMIFSLLVIVAFIFEWKKGAFRCR